MIKEFRGETRWLSNFAPVKIVIDGLTFPSTEHAYMAAKSENKEWKHLCTDAYITPEQIKRLSRDVQLVEDWNEKKFDVMKEVLTQKFNQEPYRTQLLETGNQNLQEGNRWGDKIWGVDLGTCEGENHLGRMIMEIRSTL